MRDEYERARKRLTISESDFSLVAPHRHREITLRIVEAFTTLGGEGLRAQWWWESFSNQVWALHPEDGLSVIADILTPHDRYWFVAWSTALAKKESEFWLYEATGAAILQVIPEVHFHEFYVIEKKLSWLLCENHHGVVIACGDLKRKAPNQALEPRPRVAGAHLERSRE
jgi:hypothetical protein